MIENKKNKIIKIKRNKRKKKRRRRKEKKEIWTAVAQVCISAMEMRLGIAQNNKKLLEFF